MKILYSLRISKKYGMTMQQQGKRIIKAHSLIGALLAPFILFSCKGGDNGNSSSGEGGDFSNEPEKVSYAIGVNIGENVASSMEKQGIDSIDAKLIAQGIKDRMKEDAKTLIHKDSTQQVIRSYMKKVQKRKRQANQKEGQNFLQKERKKEGVEQTRSGLTYEVLKEGSGPKPDKWDSVKVYYKGQKISGETFDSTMAPSKPAKFSVQGGVVKGWTEALQKMKEGAEWRIMLPPKLAYGRRGRGQKIGPSETLIFNIELQEVIQVDSAEAAKNQGRKGKGMSPAMKRRLRRQMQQRRGGR